MESGKCKESVVSGVGMFFKPDYIDDFCISASAYDAIYEYEEGKESEAMELGHTWKNYYFYYDPSFGDFKEYVGSEITEAELKEACGFDLAEEIRNEGYTVDNIINRDNGIININYSQKETTDFGMIDITRKNTTYNVNTDTFINFWEDGEDTWQNSDVGGKYEISLLGE